MDGVEGCRQGPHHVFSPGRVFNPDLELGESLSVALMVKIISTNMKKMINHLEHSLQIELLDLPLQPGRKARVHGRPTRQHWKPRYNSRSNLEVK